MNELINLKRDFLIDECWMLSIQGAFQHNGVYINNKISKMDKKKFKAEIRRFIEEIIKNDYVLGCVDDKRHYKNIEEIQEKTKKNKNILKNGHLNIGTVQKLFNLYLKYLWTLGIIEMPPHMPIDSNIIEKIKNNGLKIEKNNWTQIDSIDDYKKIIDNARKVAHPKPLAIWELEYFNNSRKKDSDEPKRN